MSEAMKSSGPMISIITPSFNQGAYIEQTIQSVIHQDHGHIEHIVIDGGSTDETIDVLKRYPAVVWVSEKDRGQADALNKGLAMAKGDIVGWINSDDYYRHNIFGSIVAHFQRSSAPWLVGNQADLFEDDSEGVFRQSPTITLEALMSDPDIVRQQASFFRREALVAAGGWNVDRFMAMDYDLWVRLAKISPPCMVNEDWAYFRNHAAQKSGYANILRQSAEIAEIMRREQAAPHLIASHRLKKLWYWGKGLTKERLVKWGIVPRRYRTRPIRHS
jgi:glycosyltransferase involved in cell wall biosynthesis